MNNEISKKQTAKSEIFIRVKRESDPDIDEFDSIFESSFEGTVGLIVGKNVGE